MFGNFFKNFFNAQKDEKAGDNVDYYKNMDKIKVLETKISELQTSNDNLQKQLDYNTNKELEYKKILSNFDNLLKQAVTEKNVTSEEQDATRYHLANLEKAFYDLLQKYEKAKGIIEGFQHNEEILKKQVIEYQEIFDSAKKKPRKRNSLKKNDSGTKRSLLTT